MFPHLGSVWSHWERAALRSSPAHPRSWHSPFLCPGRAGTRQALYPHYTYTIKNLLEYYHSASLAARSYLAQPNDEQRLSCKQQMGKRAAIGTLGKAERSCGPCDCKGVLVSIGVFTVDPSDNNPKVLVM